MCLLCTIILPLVLLCTLEFQHVRGLIPKPMKELEAGWTNLRLPVVCFGVLAALGVGLQTVDSVQAKARYEYQPAIAGLDYGKVTLLLGTV